MRRNRLINQARRVGAVQVVNAVNDYLSSQTELFDYPIDISMEQIKERLPKRVHGRPTIVPDDAAIFRMATDALATEYDIKIHDGATPADSSVTITGRIGAAAMKRARVD